MTREEAIKLFRRDIECLSHDKCSDCILEVACDPMKTPPDSEYIEAYGMAIEALSAEPCDDCISRKATLEPYRVLKDTDTLCVALIRANIRQQPSVTPKVVECEDCISRQATVERLCKVAEFMNEKRNGLGSPYVMAALFIQDNKDEFPTVTPKQKMGHWIIVDDCERFIAKCSECGRIEDSRMINKYPYCHCGAKMEESE